MEILSFIIKFLELFVSLNDVIIDILKGRPDKDLIGIWRVDWYELEKVINNEPTFYLLLKEDIYIKSIRNKKIAAFVQNSNATYKIKGYIHCNNTITLEYLGQNKDIAINGVVTLIISTNRNKMEGMWIQPSDNQSFIIGQTMWEKNY